MARAMDGDEAILGSYLSSITMKGVRATQRARQAYGERVCGREGVWQALERKGR